MNTSWSCSRSNIVPWWRNNNLSMRATVINGNILPICHQKKYIEQMNCIREPIISVQEQRQTREKIPFGIKCKSNYTDKCYAEYNLSSLRRGFGQLKDIHYETMELGKPSLVIHSSTLRKNENEIVIDTSDLLKELGTTELRKRFGIVHTEKYVYIVGGYIYDPQIPARKNASHDYKYDLQTRKLIPIQALPNGAIGFGLGVDDDRIYAVGGNNVNSKPLSDCYCLMIRNTNEAWIKLPDLPAPTSGPGVGVYNGELHCVGGFDVLGNESIAHGEYLILRYPQDKQWRYGPEIDVPRARPLVLVIPDDSINKQSVYVAGGFNVNPTNNKPFIVPDLYVFNKITQRWQRLTIIPNLELSHALSFNDNKLHINETIELSNQLPVTNILCSFDLRKRIWTNDIDKETMNEQNAVLTKIVNRQLKNSTQTSPSSSPLLSPEIKINQNIQIKRSDSPVKTKTSTLKMPNLKTQQNNIKSSIGKSREIDQQSIRRNKIPMNTKRNDTSVSRTLNNTQGPSLKKQTIATKQTDGRLKMKNVK